MKRAIFTLLAVLAAPATHAVEHATVLPQQSSIGFQFRQMGVPVKGSFRRFDARIRFDPARPEAAQAALDIDLASIDTGSTEADAEAAGTLWFDRGRYPVARFVARTVRPLGDKRFELRGTLALKGRRRELAIPVSYVPAGGVAHFKGSFVLRRLDFGIGEGMWADTDTVANEVRVHFDIAASGG